LSRATREGKTPRVVRRYSLADPKVRKVMALLYRLDCEPFPDASTLKETTDGD